LKINCKNRKISYLQLNKKMYAIMDYDNVSCDVSYNILKTFNNLKNVRQEVVESKNNNDFEFNWGFDLTDFNEEYQDDHEHENGRKKFQKLLNQFNMKMMNTYDKNGFIWKNEDSSIIMVTSNNPLDYIHGYLGYVGISCKIHDDLLRFLKEFRNQACYIKDQANYREYI
jgi:hypothetical protein